MEISSFLQLNVEFALVILKSMSVEVGLLWFSWELSVCPGVVVMGRV